MTQKGKNAILLIQALALDKILLSIDSKIVLVHSGIEKNFQPKKLSDLNAIGCYAWSYR